MSLAAREALNKLISSARDEINPQQRDGPREATFCTLHENLRRLCPDAHG